VSAGRQRENREASLRRVWQKPISERTYSALDKAPRSGDFAPGKSICFLL
jgi:hypothetical protein